ncbi:hypothetical protein [Methylocystis parvus]|uniref:hypothetical protein n=1 Tax=Methylocystis parvus TaxID=134 RepID=UPI003C7556C8
MIETEAIDPSGIAIDCPHCRRLLLTVCSHGPKNAFDRYLYTDDDTVPIELAPRQPIFGWDIEVRLGACPYCAGAYFGITARFIDGIPDDDVIDVFFRRNGDRGEENNFIGRRSEETWIVSRFETPVGPMLEHQFGPFAATFGGRLWPNGVADCGIGGPSDLARHFLLSQWDELRAMPKAVGRGTAN